MPSGVLYAKISHITETGQKLIKL